jgi:hypothetical protein
VEWIIAADAGVLAPGEESTGSEFMVAVPNIKTERFLGSVPISRTFNQQ